MSNSFETKRGRKKSVDRASRPYSVFPRNDLPGKPFNWSYKHPVSGVFKKNQSLKDPDTGSSIYDMSKALDVAKDLWHDLLDDKSRVDHDLLPLGKVHPKPLLKEFWAHQEANGFSPKTIKRNKRFFRVLTEYTSFEICKDVTIIDVAYCRNLAGQLRVQTLPPSSTHPEGHKPSDEFIGTAITTLAAFLTWCTVEKSLPTHVIAIREHLKTIPAYKSEEDHYYRPWEMAAIERGVYQYMAENPQSYQSCVMILLFLYTGCRVSELLRLTVDQVKLEGGEKYLDGELEITSAKKVRADRNKRSSKRGLIRRQPLYAPVLRFLPQYISVADLQPGDSLWPQRDGWAEDVRTATGKKVKWKNKAANRNSKKPRTTPPRDILEKICEMVSVEYRGFHAFRTTHINIRVRMADPETKLPITLDQVKEEVGHSTKSRVTEDVYKRPGFSLLPKAIYDLDWQSIDKMLEEARARGRRSAARRAAEATEMEISHQKVYASSSAVLNRLIAAGQVTGA